MALMLARKKKKEQGSSSLHQDFMLAAISCTIGRAKFRVYLTGRGRGNWDSSQAVFFLDNLPRNCPKTITGHKSTIVQLLNGFHPLLDYKQKKSFRESRTPVNQLVIYAFGV